MTYLQTAQDMAGSNNSQPLRVMIVDDHRIIRDGLRAVLEFYDDLNVVGEAANGLEALDLCKKIDPDIVLMDLTMPIMDGIEATAAIQQACPEVDVIAFTADTDNRRIDQVIEAGATQCLLKTAPIDQVVNTIRYGCR